MRFPCDHETGALAAIARQVSQSLWGSSKRDRLDHLSAHEHRRGPTMIWKTFVSRLAIASRRRGLATAAIYGLSLAVRFTSAAGEEVEIPPQSVQAAHPVISIMTRDSASLPYQ